MAKKAWLYMLDAYGINEILFVSSVDYMVVELVNIWKILSLIFFAGLFFFLLYFVLEKILTKRTFKKELSLAQNQLFLDIFKNDNSKIWDLLSIDELSTIDVQIKESLKELKKDIYCELSKCEIKWLEEKIDINLMVREEKLHKVVFNKYKEAIKSLNTKIVYLKNDLDAFKSVSSKLNHKVNKQFYNESQNNYTRLTSSIDDMRWFMDDKVSMIWELHQKNEWFMKDNISKVYDVIKEKDILMDNKFDMILEQKTKIWELENKLFSQTDFIENKLKQYSLDREYLDKYVQIINKQTKSQSIKNIVFIVSMVLLFWIMILLLSLILAKTPTIYSL